MDLFQSLPRDMGINLSRRDICVAEHNLHGPQVSTMFKQVACKGMPQGVWGDFFSDARQRRAPLDDLPKGLPAHGFCPGRYKKIGGTSLLQQAWAAVGQVLFETLLRL